jgi:hypothetical protein
MTNILETAEMIELRYAFLGTRRCDGGSADAALARYGADLLGRAIGHELAAPASQSPDDFYAGLLCEIIPLAIDHPTRRVMAFMAVRDVQAGR